VGHLLGCHQHVTGLRTRQARIENDRGEGGEDPGPGAQGVVGDIEPQHGKQAVAFIPRAEDTLGDVPSAAGLGAGIPEGPPLHAEMDQKGQHGQSPEGFSGETARKIGKHCSDVGRPGTCGHAQGRKLAEQSLHPSHGLDPVVGHSNDDAHLQHELKQVGPQHSPQPAKRHVEAGKRHQEKDAQGEAGRIAGAERGADDAGHGLGDPTENEAVHQQAQIKRPGNDPPGKPHPAGLDRVVSLPKTNVAYC